MGFIFNRQLNMACLQQSLKKKHTNKRNIQRRVIRSPNVRLETHPNQPLPTKDIQFLKSIGLKIRK